VRQFTHGSLFDGFGGLRRGFEDAGFITKWAYDQLYGQDLTTYDPRNAEPVDVLSGGPPCQRGSAAASFHRAKTLITLWPDMLRFVEALRPRWVVVENVPGFQRQMVSWTGDIYRLGYGCAGKLIDSRHWVPQQRTRAFIVARLGANGMELWDHLYAAGERVEGADGQGRTRLRFDGDCADCLPGGIFARVSARKLALMGAGNAVSQPVAKWLGERIAVLEAEEVNGP
jgi:DNA (cytosine-5)-methyltransferase 1